MNTCFSQDEPTSGVDPRSRHFLWNTVNSLVSAGQSVILTTHSMAECEALCSRIGVMVNGSLQCLGTPQQLKSTYGQGYLLKIRTAGPIEATKEFILHNLSNAVMKVSVTAMWHHDREDSSLLATQSQSLLSKCHVMS